MTNSLFALLLAPPLLALLLTVGLGRRVPTRVMGLLGAGALAFSLLALIALWAIGLPVESGAIAWATLANSQALLQLRLDALNAPLLALLFGGGSLALALIASAFAPDTRGFAHLWSTLLLALSGTAVGLLSADPLLLPLSWGLATLGSYQAARAAGASEGDQELPSGLLCALLAGLALLLILVFNNGSTPTEAVPLANGALLGCLLLVALVAWGLPPLHATVAAGVAAPGGVAAIGSALGLPLLGGYTLLRLGPAAPALPSSWPLVFVVVGLVALIVSGAAALRQEALRPLLGWQLSAQGGAVLLAFGAQGGSGPLALALLLHLGLVGLMGFLALALLERRVGSSMIAELPRLRAPLPLAGLAFGLAALSALGLPPTWGFWGRLWLFDSLGARFPWALPLALVGTALGALAWLAPLVAFWRTSDEAVTGSPRRGAELLPLLAGLVVLVLGVRPHLFEPLVGGVTPGLVAQIGLGLLGLALVVWALRARALPPTLRLNEEQAAAPPPIALGESVKWLGAVATPTLVYAALWRALLAVGQGVGRILVIFERRYYLAGVLLALISTILLLAQ